MTFSSIDLHTNRFTCCYRDRRLSDRPQDRATKTFELNEAGLAAFYMTLTVDTYVLVEAAITTFSFVRLFKERVKEVIIGNTYQLKQISLARNNTDKIDSGLAVLGAEGAGTLRGKANTGSTSRRATGRPSPQARRMTLRRRVLRALKQYKRAPPPPQSLIPKKRQKRRSKPLPQSAASMPRLPPPKPRKRNDVDKSRPFEYIDNGMG
jgi:hypothetical protein